MMLTMLQNYYAYATNHMWSIHAHGVAGQSTWQDMLLKLVNWFGPIGVWLLAALPIAFIIARLSERKGILCTLSPLIMAAAMLFAGLLVTPLAMLTMNNRPDVIHVIGRHLTGPGANMGDSVTASGKVATTCGHQTVGQSADIGSVTSFTLLGEAERPPYRWAARVTNPACDVVLMMDARAVVQTLKQITALQEAARHPKPLPPPSAPAGPSAAERADVAAELASVPR